MPEKEIFLISPVRGITPEEKTLIEKYVADLESQGITVHLPIRDTHQDDPIGLRICQDNLEAIKKAYEVHIWYNPSSSGSLFDLGMTFALGKPVRLANFDAVPPTDGKKSFNNVLRALHDRNLLTIKENLTRHHYDDHCQQWLEKSGGADRPCYWEDEMDYFVRLSSFTGPVLEAGCGPATDGKYLARRGINCVSIDYSSSMLKMAKGLNPDRPLSQMYLQALAFADSSFSGFWATACLLHLENPAPALAELVRVTCRGGVGFISVKEGQGDTVDPRTGYYFKYYQHQEFTDILAAHRLQIISAGRKPGTPNHDWLTYTVSVAK